MLFVQNDMILYVENLMSTQRNLLHENVELVNQDSQTNEGNTQVFANLASKKQNWARALSVPFSSWNGPGQGSGGCSTNGSCCFMDP